MSRHLTETELNDYVDGLLDERGRGEVQTHLGRCTACRESEAELRSLLGRASELGELRPARDLLPAIRAAISHRKRTHLWGALAASVLLAVGVGGVAWKLIDGPPNVASSRASASSHTAIEEFLDAEREFVEATRNLLRVLEQRQDSLPLEARLALERDLALLDEAIADTRQALATEPDRARTGQVLTALHHKKMELLWKVSRLSS